MGPIQNATCDPGSTSKNREKSWYYKEKLNAAGCRDWGRSPGVLGTSVLWLCLQIPYLKKKKKAEYLDMYCRWRSVAVVACHFEINQSSVSTIVKKQIRETLAAAMSADAKPCTFCETPF